MKRSLCIFILIALCLVGCGRETKESTPPGTDSIPSQNGEAEEGAPAQGGGSAEDGSEAEDSAATQSNTPAESNSGTEDDSTAQNLSPIYSEPIFATKDDSEANYDFTVPEDFEAIDLEGLECYYTAEDGSSISLNIQPQEPSFQEVSAELLHQALASTFSQTYGTEVAIIDLSFASEPVSGFPAYQYAFSYELQGRTLQVLAVGVNADHCYTFTFSDASGDWSEAFAQSAASITIQTP